MQTLDNVAVGYELTEQHAVERESRLFRWIERRRKLVIVAVFLVAFFGRVYRLDAAGLCEDETNKIFAVRSYNQGDLTANAEHPMLMKTLCFASLGAASIWNRAAGASLAIPEETALRLPNALFGALTVVPLFLFATALFGIRVGLITSIFWAVGLNAIWFNRIGKEDTLLVFFMLLGFYWYNRAKARAASDLAGQEMLYALSGGAFGLMLASKYFPHYYGMHALFYHIAGYDSRNNRPLTRRMLIYHFAGLLLSFSLFNFAAFLPKTWRFNWAFVNEDLLTHHGYLMMDTLYMNEMSQTPTGTPWYFYWLFIGLKLPLPLLIAFIAGLVEIFVNRRSAESARGYLFLRVFLVLWLAPMSLVGAKWCRYALALMPIIYMTAGIGIVAIWRISRRGIKLIQAPERQRYAVALCSAALIVLFLAAPAYTLLRSLPYPSLYINPLGGERIGYYFPHDEFYDLGARESIKYIADNAGPGATVASEIPGVVQYYLERFGRTDIRSLIMSHPKYDFMKDAPDYVILQKGRLYFENRDDFALIQNRYPVAQESKYLGAATAQVYLTGNNAARHRE